MSPTFVDGDDVVGNVCVWVGFACAGLEVRDGVVDWFAAEPAVAADAADVGAHAVLHGRVAFDHGHTSAVGVWVWSSADACSVVVLDVFAVCVEGEGGGGG